MAAVSKNNIARDVYRAMYSTVTNSITDMQSTARAVNRWCFSSWPDITQLDKDDFPIIIFDKPTIISDRFTITRADVTWNMMISVYTAGTSATGDKAAEQCDRLADQIYQIVNDAKFSTFRNTYNLYNVVVNAEDSGEIMIQRIKSHVKNIIYSGKFRHAY